MNRTVDKPIEQYEPSKLIEKLAQAPDSELISPVVPLENGSAWEARWEFKLLHNHGTDHIHDEWFIFYTQNIQHEENGKKKFCLSRKKLKTKIFLVQEK